jgi:hypothetical protein
MTVNNKRGVLEYSVEAMAQGTKRWIEQDIIKIMMVVVVPETAL